MKMNFNRCTNVLQKSLIEHAAYIRASAEKKKLDLDKYKMDIQNEMKTTSKSKKCKPFTTKKGKIQIIRYLESSVFIPKM